MQGYNYLRKIIEPSITTLLGMVSDVEIDPAKADPDADLAANAENLQRIAQGLVDTICDSAEYLPSCVPYFMPANWPDACSTG